MNEFTKYIGMDVHKETIAVSVAEGNAWPSALTSPP